MYSSGEAVLDGLLVATGKLPASSQGPWVPGCSFPSGGSDFSSAIVMNVLKGTGSLK